MLALTGFNVSWVDLLVVCVLAVGVFHGRKRGMSEELLDIIKWTLIVGVAGLLYEPGGRWLSRLSVFSLLSSYVFAYIIVALAIFSIFAFLRKKIGEKLVGSDVFGRGEYYLGMIAGAYRYLCVLLVVMAFLNAREYNAAEIAAKDRYQDQNFGTKLIPTLPDLQKEVFDRSLSGRIAHRHLNVVLIRPTAPSDKGVSDERSLNRRRERAVDQILDKK
ncbi:MAG: hypothetical protein QOF48_534 [Verrucomicrobiota bacterium]|jgi:uncharacterized membrane protein required for colicin V production